MRFPLLALLALVALPVLAQPGAVVLEIGSDSAAFGRTATIPMQIDITGPNPSIVVFHVAYDPIKLAYQGFTRGPVIPSDKIVAEDVDTTGISFVIYGGTSQITSGLLLTLRFTVITPVLGSTTLDGENASASTPQGSDIDVTIEDGNVTFTNGNTGISCAGSSSATWRQWLSDVVGLGLICLTLAFWRARQPAGR